MALLLSSFLFVITVRPEYTYSNAILRLLQIVVIALKLHDTSIATPAYFFAFVCIEYVFFPHSFIFNLYLFLGLK